jgi:putative endopeptidase
MRIPRPAFTLCLLGLALAAGAFPATAAVATPSPKAGGAGIDLSAMDPRTSACQDFYEYACGGWRASHPVPADQSTWGRLSEIAERNREKLRAILETASANDPGRPALTRKIGDYYASCMDEAGIEAKGLAALQPELDRISALRTGEVERELPGLLGSLQQGGVRTLFIFGAEPDRKDSSTVVASVARGRQGLPDRDYYLKDDPKSVEQRRLYTEHVSRMFGLLGETPERAQADAATVLAIETSQAKAMLDIVSRRDPSKTYHKMSRQELAALTPHFNWNAYLAALGAPDFTAVNVSEPDYLKEADRLVAATPAQDWQTYLRWYTVHDLANFLPAAFVNETFSFYGKVIDGSRELLPRWKRCVAATDMALGEALGQAFVEKNFGLEGKQRMLAMVKSIESAMETDVEGLPWMTPSTKQQAIAKAKKVANKIGYPDVWRDYSKLDVVRGDAVGNYQRATSFESHRRLAKIGHAPDRAEWNMSPPTVNAYYYPPNNDINFPAGILQPPAFDLHRDDAANYGAIGSVIGHELTHGFDDQGRKFDGEGNLKDWWSAEDAAEFQKRASCIADEYSGFTAIDDLKLNGRLTLGENTADNGGLRLAYMALQSSLQGKPRQTLDGFTPEQRFFIADAQLWCENRRPEALRTRALTDPHSPGRYRINGVVSNMPEFQKTFNCPAGAPMVRETTCRVW